MKLRVNPIVATLAMLSIARGLAFVVDGGPGAVGASREFPDSFRILQEEIGPVPLPVILAIVVVVLGGIVLRWTRFGRYAYAVGGSPTAGRAAALKVDRLRISYLALSGLLAGLAGWTFASMLNGVGSQVGVGLELRVFSAVILGGVALSGGRGSMIGTVLGVLIIGVMINGLTLAGVPIFWQLMGQGLVLLVAVALDALRHRRLPMTRLRLGVIGAGAWTVASHLPNLERHREELEFVAVNRRDPEMAESIRDTFGFDRAFSDYRDVLEAGVDICVIGSPAASHHQHAMAALEAGAHVLVEKPFTIDPAHAWEIATAAERSKRHVVVAFGANYQPMVREAKRLMTAGGGVGEVEHMAIHMASPLRDQLMGRPAQLSSDRYDDDAPVLTPAASTHADASISGGGYAPAQLSHALGLALWLTELRAADVFAATWSPPDEASTLDFHDAAVVRYVGGAIGTLSGGASHWGANANKHQQEVRIIGSEGQLHVDVEREIVWRYRHPHDDVRIPLRDGDGVYECRGPVDAIVDLASGRDVVNASPPELGARVVEIIDALYRSARGDAKVSIDLAAGQRS